MFSIPFFFFFVPGLANKWSGVSVIHIVIALDMIFVFLRREIEKSETRKGEKKKKKKSNSIGIDPFFEIFQ